MDKRSTTAETPRRLTRVALAATPAGQQKDVIGEQIMHRLRNLPRCDADAAVELLLRRDDNVIMDMLDEEGCDALTKAAETMGKAAKTKGRSTGRQRSTSQRLNQGDGM